MDLDKALEDVKKLLVHGSEYLKLEGFSWLNGVCLELIKICKFVHKFLIFESQSYGHIVETVLLCLTQLICCIRYLEKAVKTEQQEKTDLTLTYQHFLDRMIWCLTQLQKTTNFEGDGPDEKVTSDTTGSVEKEGSFVTYMDMALDTLSPLSLYPSDENRDQNSVKSNGDISQESQKVRSIIELLMGQAMAFVNVALDCDRVPLKTVCQKVMAECIEFQKICSSPESEHNMDDQDVRFKAQLVENTLYNLDKLMNNSLLRMVYNCFAEINQQPIKKLRKLNETSHSELIDDEIEKFDLILDRLMQIGLFATAYASKAKLKVNIRSCLASCEALDSCLIPSIFSSNANEHHSKLLESHWYEEINGFKCFVQSVIDTNMFCLNLIDAFDETLKEAAKNFDAHRMNTLLQQCDILCEHFKCNYSDLGLDKESKTRLYYDDFLLMVNECKAAVEKQDSIEHGRIVKRFKILLSVLKKIELSINSQDSPNKTNLGKSFTFGDVTMPRKNSATIIVDKKITDSLEVLVDFDEFISRSEDNQQTSLARSSSPSKLGVSMRRNSVFYESRSRRTFTRQKSRSISPNLKKDITAPKRASKRTSLRVAMFKRQKSLETQRFLESLSSSKDPTDSLNLQITDILDQLTDLSSSFEE